MGKQSGPNGAVDEFTGLPHVAKDSDMQLNLLRNPLLLSHVMFYTFICSILHRVDESGGTQA